MKAPSLLPVSVFSESSRPASSTWWDRWSPRAPGFKVQDHVRREEQGARLSTPALCQLGTERTERVRCPSALHSCSFCSRRGTSCVGAVDRECAPKSMCGTSAWCDGTRRCGLWELLGSCPYEEAQRAPSASTCEDAGRSRHPGGRKRPPQT